MPVTTLKFEPQLKIILRQIRFFVFVKLVKKFSGDWPREISGVIVAGTGNCEPALKSNCPLATKRQPVKRFPYKCRRKWDWRHACPMGQPRCLALTTALAMLLYAFIGGLILNIMPCVLPVIALKILGFVGEARSDPRHVRKLGLVYALGVLVSFLALAAVVIGVKAAGHRAGWGMQFGSPVFVVCLTTLVMLVALNLFGVFEVTLSGRALDAAGGLASKHGAAGAFFNGVLATALATPCTAPFLAPRSASPSPKKRR